METPRKLKFGIIFAILLTSVSFGYAQKFAYVDSDYILQNIPEYQDAQNQLDEFSENWQTDIEEKFSEIDLLYRKYQADAVLLPDDMKRKREDEIISKERETKKFQEEIFGPEGLLFKKREELVLPIQERVYSAIEKTAGLKNLGVVFDKASGASMLFSDPKLDISDEVLEELGYSYNTQRNN
ncbi:MAG: OmpH family outer membrane protein [Bacteroidales bacterium]|jgi:outer membrane protein|nr:OmpH family outer membrane protein [Bacteroidales bacterium]